MDWSMISVIYLLDRPLAYIFGMVIRASIHHSTPANMHAVGDVTSYSLLTNGC